MREGFSGLTAHSPFHRGDRSPYIPPRIRARPTREIAFMKAAVRRVTLLALREVVDFAKRLDELVLFLALDLLERPAEVLEVLDPLEIADDDAAGIGQDVGHDRDAAGVEDLVGLGPGRASWRPRRSTLAATALASSRSNDSAERGGNQHVDRHGQELLVGDGVASLEADDLVRDARRACRARRCRVPRGLTTAP